MEQETVEQETRNWAAYAGYFISGAAIGTVLGVLYAPKAGRESREEVNAWLKDRSERSRVEYRAMKEALARGAKTVRAKAKERAGA